jgi:hypothetical protein
VREIFFLAADGNEMEIPKSIWGGFVRGESEMGKRLRD